MAAFVSSTGRQYRFLKNVKHFCVYGIAKISGESNLCNVFACKISLTNVTDFKG